MKRYIFLFVFLLSIPLEGRCQVPVPATSIRSNVLAVDVNLAFGPSSTATWDPSLSFRFQVNDHFRVGIGDVSYGNADLLGGTRNAIMGGPVVEFFAPITGEMSYSVIAGVPLQTRWGAGINSTFGAAPYASGAFNYHFSPDFSLAGVLRFQYLATDAYLRTPRVLPSSALILAFGLGFDFHL